MGVRSYVKTHSVINHGIKIAFDLIEVVFALLQLSTTYHGIVGERHYEPTRCLACYKLFVECLI